MPDRACSEIVFACGGFKNFWSADCYKLTWRPWGKFRDNAAFDVLVSFIYYLSIGNVYYRQTLLEPLNVESTKINI
jgi:hypothetical protein